jgi:hypothetical protein
MATQKLTVPRATRIDEDPARVLLRVGDDAGLVPAAVDREILNATAEIMRKHWQPGQALKFFLRGLRYQPA